MYRSLALIAALLPLAWEPLHADTAGPSLEEVCGVARAVVVAKATEVREDGNALCFHLTVSEVLLGHVDKAVEAQYRNMAGACGKVRIHEEVEGIWFLTVLPSGAPDGRWDVGFPRFQVCEVSRREEVEKALSALLEGYRKTLDSESDLNALVVAPPGREIRKTPPAWSAFHRLGDAGHAAVPAVKVLLASARPIQRAWGCKLAAVLKDKALCEDLSKLLDDKAPVTNPTGGCLVEDSTVGALARQAVEEIRKP